MMARLFISYSRADKNFAIRLKNSLEAVGADVWIDLEDIEAGVKWSTAIQQGLRQSDLMLLVLSPNSVASQNVEDEWQYFLDRGKTIIPLYWRECEPHFQLSRLQYIDFRPVVNAYDEAFNQLLRILKSKGVNFDDSPKKSDAPPAHFDRGIKWWWGIGAIMVILVLVFAIYTFVLKDREGEDVPSTRTPTQVAPLLTEEATEIPTESPTERPSITPTRTPTATPTPTATLELLTQIAMEFTQTKIAGDAFASATAAKWTYTPSSTPTPTATFTATPDYTQTYEKARDEFAASVTAESWTDTPTPTPTLTEREKALKRAEEGESSNDEWTPYSEEFNRVVMVLVPKGCFMMGSEDGEDDEKPVHEQCFDEPFWIDKTEVTRAMYQECVEAGACAAKSSNQFSEEGNQPINEVSWFEAQDYCEWRGARLPTEREWEYAARGPDNLIYPWGNEFVTENVVYAGNSDRVTAIVGSRPDGASWVGALDMSGNVWEWVSSLYILYPYNQESSKSSVGNNVYSLRGGSFNNEEYIVRLANRDRNAPDVEYNVIGFRCSLSYEGG